MVYNATGKKIDAILAEQGLSRSPNAFTDTNDSDILAAYALGITKGTGNNQFSPSGVSDPLAAFAGAYIKHFRD